MISHVDNKVIVEKKVTLSNVIKKTIYRSAILPKKKYSSINHRIALWKNTGTMIANNPFSVGVGYFEFSFIPYKTIKDQYPPRENVIEKAPHNEILRFLSEDGIPSTLVGLLFIINLLFIHRKKLLNVFRQRKGCHATILLVFFMPEFFQFPLQTPFPFFVIAILLGFFINKFFYETKNIYTLSLNKKLLVSLIIPYSSIVSIYVFAKYVEKNYPNHYPITSLACKISPFDWRVCANKGFLELDKGKFITAEKTAHFELKKRKDNFVALNLLGFSLYYQGKYKEGCHKLRHYDRIFQNKSYAHTFVTKYCKTEN